MNKIEQVARAIASKNGFGIGVEEKIDDGGKLVELWRSYIPEATAAIEAMRVPTEGMVEAGALGSGEDSRNVATGAFDAMIDAALEGK